MITPLAAQVYTIGWADLTVAVLAATGLLWIFSAIVRGIRRALRRRCERCRRGLTGEPCACVRDCGSSACIAIDDDQDLEDELAGLLGWKDKQ